MNWDEKAEDYAVAHHTYEHLTPDENAYYTSGFVRGAHWQREALLSDEAVERVADILEALDGDDYLTVARVALTAAIGDDNPYREEEKHD